MKIIMLWFMILLICSCTRTVDRVSDVDIQEFINIPLSSNMTQLINKKQVGIYEAFLERKKSLESSQYARFKLNKEGEIITVYFDVCFLPSDIDIELVLKIPTIRFVFLDTSMISDKMIKRIYEDKKDIVFFYTMWFKEKAQELKDPFVRLENGNGNVFLKLTYFQ